MLSATLSSGVLKPFWNGSPPLSPSRFPPRAITLLWRWRSTQRIGLPSGRPVPVVTLRLWSPSCGRSLAFRLVPSTFALRLLRYGRQQPPCGLAPQVLTAGQLTFCFTCRRGGGNVRPNCGPLSWTLKGSLRFGLQVKLACFPSRMGSHARSPSCQSCGAQVPNS